ncbi:hypothetical protein [Nocardia sp. CC201C]|nr:hypothetical protein [Nocardia sp. CC201C]
MAGSAIIRGLDQRLALIEGMGVALPDRATGLIMPGVSMLAKSSRLGAW